MRTTTILVMAVVATGCVASGERSTIQEVATPSVTVAPRSASELAVSWTADPMAVRYNVLEGGALAASVFDSGGGAPATSWIAGGLTGQHCYVVQAVYADGSTGSASSSVCGSVSGLSAPVSVRVSVPLFGASTGSVFPGRFLSTSGAQGVSVQLPPLPIGAVITRLDARVRDSATGPTTLILAIAEQADNSFAGPGAPSAPSAGSGTFQTMTLDGQARQVLPLHTYYAGVFVNFVTPGTEPCLVSAIDVTYQPPTPAL